MWQFYVGIILANCRFRSFGFTQVLEETKGSFPCSSVLKVGQDVCNLLPVMHALTGCDSTSNLNDIGKKGGYTTLKKHKDDLVKLKNLEMGGPRMRWETLFQN